MENFIVIAVILAILVSASVYIWKEKKRGVTCIGCPDSGTCAHCKGGSCGGCSGCGQH